MKMLLTKAGFPHQFLPPSVSATLGFAMLTMYSPWVTISILSLLTTGGNLQRFNELQNAGSCPERNGRFPDPSQCDAYIECIDGVPTRKLCPDGLLFKPQAGHFSYPCFYPPEVDCLGRSSLQPAQPSGTCPHQFGYYPVGDASHCGQFMICSNGIAHIFDCPEGLAFNDQSLRCEWPDEVLSCNAEAFLGFTCPNFGTTDFGPAGYTFYRSPVTCQKYYLCINGRPRLLSCSQDEAFNEITSSCDAPENVTGCAIPERPQKFTTQPTFNNFQNQPSFFSG